jgi:hypothetical protein
MTETLDWQPACKARRRMDGSSDAWPSSVRTVEIEADIAETCADRLGSLLSDKAVERCYKDRCRDTPATRAIEVASVRQSLSQAQRKREGIGCAWSSSL